MSRPLQPLTVPPPTQPSAAFRISHVRDQAKETCDIMQQNMSRALARGETIESLQGRSTRLADSANVFRKSAARVKRHIWWKNVKTKVCCAIVVIVLIALLWYAIDRAHNAQAQSE